MRYRQIIVFLLLTLLNINAISQEHRYFKDFNYSKMSGINQLNENALPNFYLKCNYDKSGRLTSVGTKTKMKWEAYHSLSSGFNVKFETNRTFLLFGSGKQRDGYTRTIFQKKVFVSDTAMLVQDTILYKTTSDKYIRIQFFTNLNSDSINFKQMTFLFPKQKNKKAFVLSLSSFNFYKDWFNLNELADYIVEGTVKLKNDTILVRNDVKSPGFVNYPNLTKRNFDDMKDMPISFFWLKQIGLLN
jgi:hypothetical protein